MKKSILLLLAVLSVLIISCGPTPEKAIKYNDLIIAEQTAVQKKLDTLDKSFNTYIPADMEKKLADAKQQIEDSKNAVAEMDAFYKDDSFKKATLDYFDVCEKLLTDYYPEMVKLMSLPDDAYTTVEKENYEKLNNEANNIIWSAFDEFIKAQKEFADKYNFNIKNKDYQVEE